MHNIFMTKYHNSQKQKAPNKFDEANEEKQFS